MLKRIAMISPGAAIVLAPLATLAPVAVLAQTDQSAAPAAAHRQRGRTRARHGSEATRVKKGRGYRRNICIICDTRRANRKTGHHNYPVTS
jgi:hypothetical protein